ncbi:hypothetical protein KOY48_02825 [Candidatus Minimicrobia naudis]|uniref:Uncharacterized protein n=1 Tax=Candidatus Minimicrobia naudis TaxID=2841263 RepID=A0A8F1MCT0_9BACT|nr:hypothetical protein KOY48_02825 [Candidatus Minimicrobia naudis]
MASTKNRTKTQTKKPQIEMLVPILIGAIAVLIADSRIFGMEIEQSITTQTIHSDGKNWQRIREFGLTGLSI